MTTMRALLAVLCLLMAQVSWADEYQETVEAFRAAGAGEFIDSSYGYAVFPDIGKGGFFVGGAYGTGRVFERGVAIGRSKMRQATVGLQIGGQAFSQIVFFEDARALREFTSDQFEFGAQVTAVALTAASTAETSTGGGASTSVTSASDTEVKHYGYRKGMAIFTITRGGLMFEATVGGQRFDFDPLSNQSAGGSSLN
jgi:lipid-binding SYLF domain-containing protein